MIPPPPTSTLFPYTTLFRSRRSAKRPRTKSIQIKPSPTHRHHLDRAASQAKRHRPKRIPPRPVNRSEEHTSELQSRQYLVCRLLLEKKKKKTRARLTQSST